MFQTLYPSLWLFFSLFSGDFDEHVVNCNNLKLSHLLFYFIFNLFLCLIYVYVSFSVLKNNFLHQDKTYMILSFLLAVSVFMFTFKPLVFGADLLGVWGAGISSTTPPEQQMGPAPLLHSFTSLR